MLKALARSLRLAIAATLLPGLSEAASFTALGGLPGGSLYSDAYGVSADGAEVVGVGKSGPDNWEAFRWTASSGMVGLGILPGLDYTVALDASADGSAVVGFGGSGFSQQAFRWTASGGIVGLGFLPGGASFSAASDVSADGSVVVGSSDATTRQQAFRWTAGSGMVGLGLLPGGTGSAGTGVSADGSVVVGAGNSASSPQQAFRWTAGSGTIGLGFLSGGASFSTASDVSADGSVIIGSAGLAPLSSRSEAFRWTASSGMVGLGFLPGLDSTFPAAVSADGSVVVGHGRTDLGPDTAFLWDPDHGMRSLQGALTDEYGLDLTGWTLLYASDITPDGRTIVGTGIDPNGDVEAWITTIPEPGTALLLGAGLLGFSLRRQRAGERARTPCDHVR